MDSSSSHPPYRQTWAHIDLDALAANVRSMLAGLSEGSALAAIVKADAYGHGIVECAQAALAAGAALLGVAMAEEAIALREAGITAPVLVIGPSNPAQLRLGAALGLDLCVFTPEQLRFLEDEARSLDETVRIHLKIDSGMSRIGVRTEGELLAFLSALENCPHLVLEGMFTHFACADNYGDQTYTHQQYEKFRKMTDTVLHYGHHPRLHVSNSAAAQDLPAFDHDFVRFGISLYGYPPSDAAPSRQVPLHPVMKVWTEISRIQTLEAGESVGYGASYTVPARMRIATVQIGYGDGLNRLLSNRGFMIVKTAEGPVKAPITGRVCMDMTMIDVTDAPKAREGDAVLVMGTMGDLHMNAQDMADLCGTIPYEILLGYTARLPRLYRGNHG